MPVGGDVTQFFLGLMGFLGDCTARGRLPVWNDLWGYGFPGLAESQMGCILPGSCSSLRWLSTETAYVISLVLHTLWGGLGAFWAARRLGSRASGRPWPRFPGRRAGSSWSTWPIPGDIRPVAGCPGPGVWRGDPRRRRGLVRRCAVSAEPGARPPGLARPLSTRVSDPGRHRPDGPLDVVDTGWAALAGGIEGRRHGACVSVRALGQGGGGRAGGGRGLPPGGDAALADGPAGRAGGRPARLRIPVRLRRDAVPPGQLRRPGAVPPLARSGGRWSGTRSTPSPEESIWPTSGWSRCSWPR